MKILTSQSDFDISTSSDLISLECQCCHKTFTQPKHELQWAIKRAKKTNYSYYNYCSQGCCGLHKTQNGNVQITCGNCGKPLTRIMTEYSASKSKKAFCNHSCSATYNNTHKTTGYRRSKLEVWLEQELPKLYPNLEFHFNRKDAINSELDIYIPSLKLAFELNGIFHYEPIYSEKKLKQTQNNDERKFQACIEQKIELCIIDTSKQTYFKEQTATKFLNIISEIITKKTGGSSRS